MIYPVLVDYLIRESLRRERARREAQAFVGFVALSFLLMVLVLALVVVITYVYGDM